jgi:lysophospholipase L1-like esterase
MSLRSNASASVLVFHAILISIAAAQTTQSRLATLFICGDSTAAPTRVNSPTRGWAEMIEGAFDPSRIRVENRALGGRSSRTFITEGRWKAVADSLQKGDFVILQFGHNDTKAPISANRYTLPGLGNEVEDADGPNGTRIQIHTFGYYMQQMVDETLAKGAVPIFLSPVPRCKWADGKIVRGEDGHGPWAQQVAKLRGVAFVDVNAIIADIYDPIGQPRIKLLFFPVDNTHTNEAGAAVNAACVVQEILQLSDVQLKNYLRPNARTDAAKVIADVPTAAAKVELAPATKPAGTP